MQTKPYGKNQLYKGHYPMSKGGAIKIPDNCNWLVGRYRGNCMFSFEPINKEGTITLILNDNKADEGFWSVISFLTPMEAELLGKALIEASATDR